MKDAKQELLELIAEKGKAAITEWRIAQKLDIPTVEFETRIGIPLRDASLVGQDLSGVNLAGANLRCADLSGCDLRGTNLSGASLRGARLVETNLEGANLRGAKMSYANFDQANLRGADISHAEAINTTFSKADLSEARLDTSSITSSTLKDAKLCEASLRLTDLRCSIIENADFTGAKLLTTRMGRVRFTQKGTRHPDALVFWSLVEKAARRYEVFTTLLSLKGKDGLIAQPWYVSGSPPMPTPSD